MSMNPNVLPSDRAAIVGVIDPDAATAATYTTAWVDAGLFDTFLAVIQAGELGASATVDAKFEQATDGTGTDAKDVADTDIAQLAQGADDDSQALINLYSHQVDVAGGFSHVRLSLTVGTATSDVAALLLGLDARYQPAAQAASVVEVVS